jgi:NADH-quinone oxidoreductase subunit L
MTVALGASAYAAGIFHLMTHAFFKALLFLGAGSVIIAMHHEQDMRKMGGLKKYMPITYWTALVGSLALIGFPFLSGFYSKDAIIEAVHHSTIAGSSFAYWAVLIGVFITALYSFRMFFMVFHGKERMDEHTREHLHETPPVVTVPLILLAIPSAVIGFFAVKPMLFGEYFGGAIKVSEGNVLTAMGEHFHGAAAFALHGMAQPPFFLAMAGVLAAWFFTLKRPDLADAIKNRFALVYRVLVNKYGFDRFNEIVFAAGGRAMGRFLWRIGDVKLIDGLVINGSARLVGWVAGVVRHVQTGYLYHYAFVMILGLLFFMTWLVMR